MEEKIWVQGRAFIFEGESEIEYFHRFEKRDGIKYIRSFCGNLRLVEKCKALNYVQDPEHLHLKF